MKQFVLNGYHIHDIPTFYEEVNRVFMQEADWKLGESLDAFNDLLYGGFGALAGNEPFQLIWRNFEQNKQDLGKALTQAYYQKKLEQPAVFNTPFFTKQLDDLNKGKGKTYFDIILEIISSHTHIELVAQ
ncbi:hypothetical protein GCM10023231_18590 [Olivibacter ginsenosidimutans]|uniref:Barstar (barnase inhibitor) domain-containing protein n=1 Tax=Olivibacter ginsenosidimutans TaxID=1176537 RepID=A0ABP9B5K1_9SPHI